MCERSRDDRTCNADTRPSSDREPILQAYQAGGWFLHLVPGDVSRDLATQVAAYLSDYLNAEPADGPER